MQRLAIMVGIGIIVGMLLQAQHALKIQKNNENPENLCCLAFSKIGVTLLESRLDAWATIKKSSSPWEMKQLLRKIGRALEIEINPDSLKPSGNNELTIIGTSIAEGNKRCFLTAQCSQGTTMVLVSLVTAGSECPRVHQYQENIEKTLPVNTALQCTATTTGDVGVAGRKRLIKQMFDVLNARTIEVYENTNATSATGYTPLISNSLGYGNKQYNVQAAARYNAVENKTYIYLGTPLLLGDY